jgi:hypothetical protein
MTKPASRIVTRSKRGRLKCQGSVLFGFFFLEKGRKKWLQNRLRLVKTKYGLYHTEKKFYNLLFSTDNVY